MKSNHLIIATIVFLAGLTVNALVSILDIKVLGDVEKLPDSALQQGFIFDGENSTEMHFDGELEQ